MNSYVKLNKFLTEYTERNTDNQHKPVAVGRYGIRTRESIYSKELAKDYSKNKVIFQNTLTVGMGSVQIDIGILTEDAKYSVSPAYHTYKIAGINPDYLRYCLECRNQDMFERYVKRGSRQGKTIDLGRWLTYEIPVCEEYEQKEIVSKLNFVDSLITARREQLAKLDELVKSRFIEMFGEPLTLLESGKTISLEKVFSEITVGFVGEAASSYVKVGIPYLRTQNVRKGYIDFSGLIYVSEEFHGANRKSQIKPGDIVVSRVGVNRGMAAVIPQTLEEANIANCLIIKKEKTVNSEYLAHYLNMSYGLSPKFGASVGSAQGVINTAILKKWEVFLPPYSQQEQFAAFVEQTDKSKFEIQKSLEKLETLKKALMQKYFG